MCAVGSSRAQQPDVAYSSRQQPYPVTAISTLITTQFTTPLLGGALLRAAFDAVSSSTGAGLATPENVSPPTRSVVTVSVPLLCLYEARI